MLTLRATTMISSVDPHLSPSLYRLAMIPKRYQSRRIVRGSCPAPVVPSDPAGRRTIPHREVRMLNHKFRVGQAVTFVPGRGIDHRSQGRYTIVRFLPFEGNTPQYRIKNNADGQERVVREHELGSQ